MLSHFINESDHWRARAEEARNLAHRMNDAESRDAMLRIVTPRGSVFERGAQPHTSRERPPTEAAYCCEPK
jgi:photosystem II stability/assembly factor-like uncharacterized protein